MSARKQTAPPDGPVTRVYTLKVGRTVLHPGDYLRVARGPGGTYPARFRHVEVNPADGAVRWVQVTKAKPGAPASTHSIPLERIKLLPKAQRVRLGSDTSIEKGTAA